MGRKTYKPMLMALLAALLYGLNVPAAKCLLKNIEPMFMVGLLYCGAGAGMLIIRAFSNIDKDERSLSRKELPAITAMVILDVIAPFLLMKGLQSCNAANASLLNNFEMVATSLIALCFFREAISTRTWIAIALVTIASILLTINFQEAETWRFSTGSLLVLGACTCWGLENNCTRVLSIASPLEIVVIKGFGSGLTAFAIAVISKENFPPLLPLLRALLLGVVAYGMSIYFYVYAQRSIGAARTSACYAASPFISVLLSMLILHEFPGCSFWLAFAIMLSGICIISRES